MGLATLCGGAADERISPAGDIELQGGGGEGKSNAENPKLGETHHFESSVSLDKRESVFADIEKVEEIENQYAITWQNVKVTVGQKTLLHDVSGYVKPGQMLAIMGPSGSGKTTLLNTLSSRIRGVRVQGDILVNGEKKRLNFGRAGFVAQDDALQGVLTVRETMWLSAMLRLPAWMSPAEKKKRVDKVLHEIGLHRQRKTFNGNWQFRGLSGGERRRLSIGMELIRSPPMLFLDEPTSGLDSYSSYVLMKHLLGLAREKRSLIATIHQPSSEVFGLFDNLLLLSRGRAVYFGPAQGAIDYFTRLEFPIPQYMNPSDHYLKLLNTDFVTDEEPRELLEERVLWFAKEFDENIRPETEKEIQNITSTAKRVPFKARGADPFMQTHVLFIQHIIQYTRNLGIIWVRVFMYVFLCLCMGTLYWDIGTQYSSIQDRGSVLFFTVAFLTFMSIAAFPALIEDLKVFLRDRENGAYGVLPYTIANSLANLPFVMLIGIISSLIAYYMIGLNPDADRFFFFMLLLGTSLYTAESMMMMITALVPNFLAGLGAGAAFLGVFMLLCGFFRLTDEIPDVFWRYPLHYLSFHRYAFRAFMENDFRGLTFDCPTDFTISGCTEVSADTALQNWDLSDVDKWADWAVLVAMSIIYRILFFVALKVRELPWGQWYHASKALLCSCGKK